ncbi:MAG: tol-pal system protein YbgF [Minwuia sp.]|uniref:tol-pal system protein YbgF n=1 Tax=Minwuia sp. TaxID=2493630 RepID=UPI003A847729
MMRFLAVPALVCAVMAADPHPAAAQDLAPLQDRVDRLERSINDLKQFVHRGKPLPAGTEPSGAALDSGSEGGSITRKIDALEAEVRDLTNRLEEINFTVRRLDDRLTRLVEDVDFRLTAIERNMSAGGAPAGGSDTGTAPGSSSSAAASGPRSLGTVSQGAVDNVPANGGDTDAPRTAAVRTPAEAPASALEGAAEDRYAAAFGLLQSKRFGEAEDAFRRFVGDHPEHELAGNAQYWLGETYYVQGDYERAAGAFLDGYKKYRSSSKAADNLLKLGITLSLLNQKADACAVFAELGDRFPNAPGNITRRAKRERKNAGC